MTDETITRGSGDVFKDIGMSPAKALLTMIEKVEPSDEWALDEIDLRVTKYLLPSGEKVAATYFNKFTRSRDALKNIRPMGWDFVHVSLEDGDPKKYHAGFEKSVDGNYTYKGGSLLPTEELAELHAIIQAIAHERSGIEADGEKL